MTSHFLFEHANNQGRLRVPCPTCGRTLAYCDTWAEYLRLAAQATCPKCAPKLVFTFPKEAQP